MSCSFVEKPHLPNRCKTILLGEKYEKTAITLMKLGFIAINVPNNPDIDPRLSSHADLSVIHMGGERLLLAPYLRNTDFAAQLMALGAKLDYMKDAQGSAYPFDAGLNACILKDRLFANTKSCSSEIINYFTSFGVKILDVRQGYARCSICALSENAIITADSGIAACARFAGMNTLLINPGHILLEGFPYGFIGGAAFKLSDKQLAFTGSLDGHPDRQSILSFLDKEGISPVFLTDDPIFDIGSAIPLTES